MLFGPLLHVIYVPWAALYGQAKEGTAAVCELNIEVAEDLRALGFVLRSPSLVFYVMSLESQENFLLCVIDEVITVKVYVTVQINNNHVRWGHVG